MIKPIAIVNGHKLAYKGGGISYPLQNIPNVFGGR